MAINPDARSFKLAEQFLANDGAQATGFLGTLNQDIAANKAARRAAQKGARGQASLQRGLGQMRSIPGQPILNPSPSTVTIPGLQQALPPGPGPGTMGQRAAGPVIGGGAPRPMGPIPQGIPAVTSATTQIGPAGNPGAMPQATTGVQAPRALGPGPARAVAASADDLIGAAANASTAGDSAAAAKLANDAGAAAKTAGTAGLRSTATNLGVNITKTGLVRGAGMAGVGLMASQFFDGMDLGGENSIVDRGGSGAILGAGLGGGAAIALGLGAGPVGWAALGGAALFAGYKTLWGDKQTTPEKMRDAIGDTRETIASLGEMYGIEGEAMQDIMLQYEASTAMYLQNEDKDGLKTFMAGMGTQLPALMLAAREEQKAGQQEKERFDTMMAAQAQFAPIFERTLDRASQASQTAYQTANGAANYLDQRQPQLAALYRQTAAQSQASAANLQAAYAKQMATAPVVTGTTDQLQRQLQQEQLMAQQLQMAGQM